MLDERLDDVVVDGEAQFLDHLEVDCSVLLMDWKLNKDGFDHGVDAVGDTILDELEEPLLVLAVYTILGIVPHHVATILLHFLEGQGTNLVGDVDGVAAVLVPRVSCGLVFNLVN